MNENVVVEIKNLVKDYGAKGFHDAIPLRHSAIICSIL